MNTHRRASARAIAAGLAGAVLLSLSPAALAEDNAGEAKVLLAIRLAVARAPMPIAPLAAKVAFVERTPMSQAVSVAPTAATQRDPVPRDLRELVARRFTIVSILERAHEEAPLVPSPWARVEVDPWFGSPSAPVWTLALSATGEVGGSATGITIDSNMDWTLGEKPGEERALPVSADNEAGSTPVTLAVVEP
jgi:hypothetical protein